MMSCERCGSPCQGHRCRGCEEIGECEARHGETVDREDADEWTVAQTGLDGEAEGQATLTGDIAKPVGGEE